MTSANDFMFEQTFAEVCSTAQSSKNFLDVALFYMMAKFCLLSLILLLISSGQHVPLRRCRYPADHYESQDHGGPIKTSLHGNLQTQPGVLQLLQQVSTSTLRQRKGRPPPAVHHVTVLCQARPGAGGPGPEGEAGLGGGSQPEGGGGPTRQ